MRKFILIIIAILLTTAFGVKQPLHAQNASGELTVWSFSDDLDKLVNDYYANTFPGVEINYSKMATELFKSRLDAALKSGRNAPDIFALEASFVRKYVESGLLLDLTDIYERNKNILLKYPVEIGTYNGKVYALSWQAYPGAMFYRRSLAKKYIGTDDPKQVQTYFANINKFLETAQLLKDKSNGRCVVVSSSDDLNRPFYNARQNPWVVDGKLVIDPVIDQYMDILKNMNDNGLSGGVGAWSEGWFAGMMGGLKDKNGSSLEVFSYFLPIWGLDSILKLMVPRLSGDWAIIQGPLPYYYGGTWIGAHKGTKNPDLAKQLIEWITTNDAFLEKYALASGEMVSNIVVIDKIKNKFNEPFLGGQNHYAEFAEIAKNINGKLDQSYDDVIQDLFQEAAKDFVSGKKTKQQALTDFRNKAEKEIAKVKK